MEDSLEIEVTYKGIEYSFPAQVVAAGFVHKIIVVINGIEVIYEPDEERNYRAIVNDPGMTNIRDIDKALIMAVGEKIASVHK